MGRKVIVVTYKDTNFRGKRFDGDHPLKQVENVFGFVKENNEFEIFTSSSYVLEALAILEGKYGNIEFVMNGEVVNDDLTKAYKEISARAFSALDEEKSKVYFGDI